MAAIDKIYLNDWDEYVAFREWCEAQPKLKDKYGTEVSITRYMYKYDEPWKPGEHVVFMAPYYVDAYLIRNCPFENVQKELMISYGHTTQEDMDEMYKYVMEQRGGKEDEARNDKWWWLSEKDFEVVDGVVTMPDKAKSSYTLIKEGALYATPFTGHEWTPGHHFRCTKHPKRMWNRAFDRYKYWVQIRVPDGLTFMHYDDARDTWDFCDEFVVHESYCSNTAHFRTIRAIKRHMLKWKLPVGTKVHVTGRYTFDDYEFIITK